MRKQALGILTAVSLLVMLMLTAASVCAQTGARVDITVPFDFVIGTKTFSAGTYALTYKDSNTIQIQGRHRVNMFFPTTVVDTRKRQNELIFKRYGDQVFLSAIFVEGDDAGRAVKVSPIERQLIQARKGMDKSSSDPEIVSIKLGETKH